jgi:collagenase-like PrtC family protease
VLRLPDWLELAEKLAAAGKDVVLSTQTLIESESDLKVLRKIVRDGRFLVEANEWGAVRLLSEAKAPFVAGPTLNVYNPETLDVLASLGARRWLPPVEVSRTALAALMAHAPAAMETEVFAYGKLPLAYSARCFTARHYNLPKDDCQFRCLDHPDGLPLATREGKPFLTINGIQTQSAGVYNLIDEVASMRDMGIDCLRLSPQSRHMERVVRAFDAALAGETNAMASLVKVMPGPSVDGYWHGRAGLEQDAAQHA